MTKILSCAAVLGLLVASSSSVFAGGHGGGAGASSFSPGQKFIAADKQPTGQTPGASGYSPGQQMRNNVTPTPGVTAPGNGAAVYAPGFLK
jgi:hypothetical protein